MTPEILAKIMGIIAKTGERVIVIDPKSGSPFAILSLDEYEKLIFQPKTSVLKGIDHIKTSAMSGNFSGFERAFPQGLDNLPLTHKQPSGMIEPDLTPKGDMPPGIGIDAGLDEIDQDRYYMEPTE